MASTNSERLNLLQEHIRLSLHARKRAVASGVEPSSSDTYEISRSLETLHQGIEQLEREQSELENAGELSSAELREREDVLIQLRSQHDELAADFAHSTAPQPTARGPSFDEAAAAREALMGSRETPSTLRSKAGKTVRFRDSLVDTEEMTPQQVLQLHNRVMEEQDESLERLSHSIRNQRELSIQIGDELESQVQLLDDLDESVDRHTNRLNDAKKRLNNFAKAAKEHGSLVVIVVLIIILVLLIAILK